MRRRFTTKVEAIVVMAMKVMMQTMVFVGTITRMTKEDHVSGHTARMKRMKMHRKFLYDNLKERDCLENLDMSGKEKVEMNVVVGIGY
jgi:hypothetical protein